MTIGPDGYWHPASVDEVRVLVTEARRLRRKVRVRGSGHSPAEAILAGADETPAVRVMLDRLNDVVITPDADGRQASVAVGAGCHLGFDPYDPTGQSTWVDSLSVRLHDAGYGLSALGGISHQTVAGYLLTGSAGGSIERSWASDIVRIQFVDGTGTVHEVGVDDVDRPEELFEAIGVSFGLLGIVTRVWLRVSRTYDIRGHERTMAIPESPVDLFGEGTAGRPSLATFLEATPYSRIFWFPQHGFDRLQIWSAEPVPHEADADVRPLEYLTPGGAVAGSFLETIIGNLDDLSQAPERLESMDWQAHAERWLRGERAELVRPRIGGVKTAGRLRTRVARVTARMAMGLTRVGCRTRLIGGLGRSAARLLPRHLHRLMGLFVRKTTKEFYDAWPFGLPNGNEMDDVLWPTVLAEGWLPLDRAATVMRRLRELFAAGGNLEARYRLTKAFPLEIYAGPPSRFWLSPGYRRPGVRLSIIWMSQWAGNPERELFGPIIEAVQDLGYRPHWGKQLPPAGERWREHYRREFPRLGDFLALRRELDPDGLFLTDYWRAHLGIASG